MLIDTPYFHISNEVYLENPNLPSLEQLQWAWNNYSNLSEAQELFRHLNYLNNEFNELIKIQLAFCLAAWGHRKQFRQSGESYITHPISVALYCAQEWQLDADSICCALLHDVIEDCGITQRDLTLLFNMKIAEVVQALSKLEKVTYANDTEKALAKAEDFRRMLLAISQDMTVILIKLSDRLHNMKTLGSMRLVKRKRIAQETLAIYCPLSQRLGLYQLWQELQNLCLAQTHHFRFSVLQKISYERQQKWAKKLEKSLDTLHNSLKNYFFEVSLKPSHKPIAMIYARMKEEKRNFDEVMNLCSYVVIVPDELACYQALGLIHKQFTPLPGRFKDHIAIPKNNGYQSLHTIVMSPYNIPVEFQIRTLAMDQQASWGIILAQKSNNLENNSVGKNSINKISLHGWLDHVLALSNSDLIHSIKEGLASDAVYVLTPKSEVKVLPRGATALDFAFSIHSQVGLHAVKVKIDGYLQPLDTELKNGNHVQIITSKEVVNYSLDDLKRLRTSFARQQLKHSLKKQGITHH